MNIFSPESPWLGLEALRRGRERFPSWIAVDSRDWHQDDPCQKEVGNEKVQSEDLDAGKESGTLRSDGRQTTHNRRKKYASKPFCSITSLSGDVRIVFHHGMRPEGNAAGRFLGKRQHVRTPPFTFPRSVDSLLRRQLMSSLINPSKLWVPVKEDEDGGKCADDDGSKNERRDELRSAIKVDKNGNVGTQRKCTHVEVVVSLFVADMTRRRALCIPCLVPPPTVNQQQSSKILYPSPPLLAKEILCDSGCRIGRFVVARECD